MKRFLTLLSIFTLTLLITPVGALADGMLIARPNDIINETDQKAVIWHDGKTQTLILSITFKGDADEFAWIIPVPSKPEVDAGVDEIFTALTQLTNISYSDTGSFIGSVNFAPGGMEKSTVTVIETKKVDIYDIAVLTAKDTTDLRKWLEDNDFTYPESREHLLKSYVNKDWYFVAAKINTKSLSLARGLKTGHATPLKLTFESEKIVYPLKISGMESYIPTTTGQVINAFSFENGSTQGWYGGRVIKKEAYYGNYVISNEPKSYTLPENYQYFVTRIVDGLTIGKKYVLSAYVKSDSEVSYSENDYVYLAIGYPSNQSQKIYLKDLKNWTRISLSLEAKTQSASLQLVTNALDPLLVYWDAIQIEEGTIATEFKKEVITTTNLGNIRPTDNTVNLLLYVFSDHKQEVPGWRVDYAGKVGSKAIKRLAVDDNGDPWIENSKNMYLTRLSRNMRQSEMTSDVYPRQSANDNPVGGGSSTFISDSTGIKILLILVLPLLVEIAIFGYIWYRRYKK